eukprot:33235-Prorocentrum_minimum.AAC.2
MGPVQILKTYSMPGNKICTTFLHLKTVGKGGGIYAQLLGRMHPPVKGGQWDHSSIIPLTRYCRRCVADVNAPR